MMGGFAVTKSCDIRIYNLGLGNLFFCLADLVICLIVGCCLLASQSPLKNLQKFKLVRICLFAPLMVFITIYATTVIIDTNEFRGEEGEQMD